MFKPESWQSHDEYRTIVATIGHRLSRNNPKYSFNEYDEERQKLLNLNLDPLLDYIPAFYSKGGRPAEHQAQILRSLILFVLLFNKSKARTSLTLWVREVLPKSISLAVLIGCASLEELPPLGSYYDFMNRFWTDPRKPYSRTALLPAGRNGKKPKKLIGADGKLAEPEDPCMVTAKDIVNDILDGCGRHYSDPDATWGWDSDNKTWYFGHTLYMLCARNNTLKVELPLLMKFTDARRHDSKNFLYSMDDFGRNAFGISPKNVCLDSAHDNLPTYELLEHWDINALIDINGRAKSSGNAPDGITFDKSGHPICPAGHEMCPWGNDPIKDAHKYRCPLRCGRISSCANEAACSPGSYGRTVYVKNHADLRFHPRIPRDSEEYRRIYSERTACERINDRVLNDYCLQNLKIRGRNHFSFWGMLIGICIHLDARYKVARLYAA